MGDKKQITFEVLHVFVILPINYPAMLLTPYSNVEASRRIAEGLLHQDGHALFQHLVHQVVEVHPVDLQVEGEHLVLHQEVEVVLGLDHLEELVVVVDLDH